MTTHSDKTNYIEKAEAGINSLLESDFININPFEYDESFILNLINVKNNRKELFWNTFNMISNFCSFVTIDNIYDDGCHSDKNKTIQLKTENNQYIHINYSEFKYGLKPVIYNFFEIEKCVDLTTRCTINSQYFDPILFNNMIGDQLLYMYSFPCLNSFMKQKTCYRFMNKNSNINECLLKTQIFILKNFIKNTDHFVIPIQVYYDEYQFGYHKTEKACTYFTELFNNKYKHIFTSHLSKIEDIANKHNIQLIDNIWLNE